MGSRDQRSAPRSLTEAREVAGRGRPARDAGPVAWAAFHRRNATVYAEVAKVDTRHHHEASQYAAVELRRAREIEHLANPSVDHGGEVTV